MPETVQDDDEGSDVTPTDDVESAAPIESNSGGVKFGWIRGVLVSYVRLSPLYRSCLSVYNQFKGGSGSLKGCPACYFQDQPLKKEFAKGKMVAGKIGRAHV